MTPAGKQMLLDLMEVERARWDALIAEFSEEQMHQPGLDGGWSVKDVIAHVAMYEAWTAEQIRLAREGSGPPPEMTASGEDEHWDELDWRNARFYEMNKDKPLSQVKAESTLAFEQLLDTVRSLSEEELRLPHPWMGPRPIFEIIPVQSYEHYHQHIPALRVWLERVSAASTQAASQGVADPGIIEGGVYQ